MMKEHINTFLILTERARQSGLIQFAEMPAVLQAIEAAKKEIETPEAATKSNKDAEKLQNKAG